MDEETPDRRHARDAGVRIGGRHFRIGSSEIAQQYAGVLFAASRPRQVQAARRHDVSRATVNKDRRENYRVGRWKRGRALASKSAYVRTRNVRGVERSGLGEGGERCEERRRGREGCEGGVDLPGRDVSLTHSVSLTQTDVHHGQAGS